MAQDRKVFVGGVPQDLNQDDLYAIFSEYAGVKKAWLQKCRTADDGNGGGNPSPAQKHRGFGFVIFQDAHVIDELLGTSASRFIVLRNGAKLEVKRALSSNKMGAAQVGESVAGAAAATSQQQSQELQQQQAAGRGAGRGQAQQAFRGSDPPQHLAGLQRSLQPKAAQARAGAAQGRTAPVPWPGSAGADVLRQLSLAQPGAGCYPGAQQMLASLGGAVLPRSLGLGGHCGGGEAGCTDAALSGYGLPLSRHLASAGTTPASGLQAYGAALAEGQAGRQAPLRDAIVRFYNEHRPEKLNEQKFIDFICSEYEGREALLDEALRHKYGIGLQLGAGGAARPATSPSPPPGLLGTGPRPGAPAAAPAAAPEGAGGCLAAGLGVSCEPLYAPAVTCPPEATRPARISLAAPGLTLWNERENLPDGGLSGNLAASNVASILAQGVRKGHLHQGAPAENSLLEDLDSTLNDPEGPDFTWIDQIVGDDSFDISEEVARKIVSSKCPPGPSTSRSHSYQRTDALQGVVW